MLRILAGLVALLFAGIVPAHAEWRRAESPSFILYGNMSESALRTRILLLEEYDRLLRALNPGEEAPTVNKLHVYIVSGLRDLQVVRQVPVGVAGFYTTSDDGILAMVDGSVEDAGNEILFHEYTHHFMMQNSAIIYPSWFVEGFAEYFATVRFVGGAIEIGKYSEGRAYALSEDTWLPMDRILNGGIGGLNQEAAATYYAQSWLLVHYFYSTPERQAALARLMPAIRRGNPVDALRSATGLTPDGLARELHSYMEGGTFRFRRMARTTPATPIPVTVTVMPRSTNDLILYQAALDSGLDAERGAAYLPRIRAAAARYPDDPLAMRVRAHAELLFGDGATADGLLDRLLVASPGDADLLYLKGMRWLVVAEGANPPENAMATARQWFSRAQRANPNHYQALYRYAQSLRDEPAYATENTSNVLVLAHQLAPQVPSITMSAASLLIARRDYAPAIAMLLPLAANPHDAGLAQSAREMIGRARAAMSTAAPAEPAAPGP